MSFKQYKLRTKIIMLVTMIFILFAVFVVFWLIPTINDVIMDRTVAKLEHLTEVPLTVLQKYDAMVDKGTLTLEEAQQGAMEEIRVYRFNTDDYFFINSYDGHSVMHPINEALQGQDMVDTVDSNGVRFFEEMSNVAKNEGRGTVGYLWPKPGENTDSEKLSFVIGFDKWNWFVGTGVYIDDVRAIQSQMLKNVLLVVSGILIVSIGLALYMATSISKPIEKLNAAAQNIAEGDLNTTLDTSGKDEVADLSRSFELIISQIRNVVESAEKTNKDIMVGDLTERIETSSFKGGWLNLVNGINGIADTLEGHIRKVPAVIMAIDTEFNVRYLNEAGREMLDIDSKGDVAGFKCYDLFKTEQCKTGECACGQAMRLGHAVSNETVAQLGDKVLDISYEGMPLKDIDGNIVGAFELVTDQTTIKEAAREQKRQAEKQAEEARVKAKQTEYQSMEVQKLISSIENLAKGELEIHVDVESPDEDTLEISHDFEEIYGSLKSMVSSIRSYIDETSEILENLAGRNLDVGIERAYLGDFAKMKSSINVFTQALNSIFEEIGAASHEIAEGANEVSSIAQSLSSGSTQQASSIQEITASMNEISSQTRKNAERAQQAEGLAGTVKTQAESGQGQMNEMLEAMEAINKSSNEISNIIKVIDEIAFQTNILALNAAVEAARAGEHGKGFAVVAEEVRNLAARSANAANETTQMIEDSIRKVQDGASIADQTAEALKSITSGVDEVNGIVRDITMASSNQAQAISQINEGINQVSDVTQLNAETAQRGAAASEEMAAQADMLQDTVGSFKLKEKSPKKVDGVSYQSFSIEKDA